MISLFEGIMLSLLVLGTLGITSYLNRIMKKRGFKVNRALNLSLMWDRCYDSPECEISTGIGRRWEYRLLTNDYALYILCNPEWGDYNFYVHCYDKEMLMNKMMM